MPNITITISQVLKLLRLTCENLSCDSSASYVSTLTASSNCVQDASNEGVKRHYSFIIFLVDLGRRVFVIDGEEIAVKQTIACIVSVEHDHRLRVCATVF